MRPVTGPAAAPRRGVARLLSLFSEVRPGEAGTALRLTLTMFLLLTAYDLLRVAREPLILLPLRRLRVVAAPGREAEGARPNRLLSSPRDRPLRRIPSPQAPWSAAGPTRPPLLPSPT